MRFLRNIPIMVPGVLCAIVGVVLVAEAVHIGLLANATTVSGYHFGSESMLGHGGYQYTSRAIYVGRAGVVGALLSGLAVLLFRGMGRTRQHAWRLPATIAALVGLLVAGLAMTVAWRHNPQGAVVDQNGIDWSYWLGIGVSWFLPVYLVLVLLFRALLRSSGRGGTRRVGGRSEIAG